ncbi:MAG: NADH-quinone oxidoreductase subunit N [Chitinophagaceae bacterium]|nr:NADH-quinone oxidoreductase subunit N [Chitinophagaceae bacterium]MCW5904392.1 NADH-quinone oxidoreductase subunit N [Chitinophagaceae bacterium]
MNAIIISALMGVLMMFTSIITSNKQVIKNVALIALLFLLVGNIVDTYNIFSIKVDTKGMLSFGKFGLYFNTLIIAATTIFVLLSGNEIVKTGDYAADYFALIFFVLCGIAILSSFNNLLMMFLGVEIMSIPLYILTGSAKKNLKSNEASLKYFLMGAFSTGIMLMGIALMYGATGSFGIQAIKLVDNELSFTKVMQTPLLEVIGLLLVYAAMLFKVSAAPFHFWAPDVYDGAPSAFASFMATIVKAAGFIALINLFFLKAVELHYLWKMVTVLVIITTLIIGNITAVFQQSVKRMLAYSSIAHAGFMMFALYAQNDIAKEGILIYTVAYSLATIGLFAILAKMDDYSLEGYNGMAKTQPLLAFANAIFLLSLAGIPLTVGFFAKYYMLAAVLKFSGGFGLFLTITGVVFAAVSVYYYFRVLQAMYFKEGDAKVADVTVGFKLGLMLCIAAIIFFGIFPDVLLAWFYF